MLVAAGATGLDMAAESSRATAFDAGQNTLLNEGQRYLTFKLVSVLPNDVGDVEEDSPGRSRRAHQSALGFQLL